MTNQPFKLPTVESRRDELSETRLSRLPKLADRPKFELPKAARCKNCSKILDRNDDYQIAVQICRQCLKTFGNVGLILENYAVQKIRRNYTEAK